MTNDHFLMTDIGMLQIQIVKSFEQDLPGIDDYILRYPICSMSPQDYDGASSSSSTLCICDPVDYYVNPTKQPWRARPRATKEPSGGTDLCQT